jgi:hypothetical protein
MAQTNEIRQTIEALIFDGLNMQDVNEELYFGSIAGRIHKRQDRVYVTTPQVLNSMLAWKVFDNAGQGDYDCKVQDCYMSSMPKPNPVLCDAHRKAFRGLAGEVVVNLGIYSPNREQEAVQAEVQSQLANLNFLLKRGRPDSESGLVFSLGQVRPLSPGMERFWLVVTSEGEFLLPLKTKGQYSQEQELRELRYSAGIGPFLEAYAVTPRLEL